MIGKETHGYFKFRPEVIVEVTMVCDRACSGCYAPNLISHNDSEAVSQLHPELFIKPDVLHNRLSEITSSISRQLTSLSFRGGEPAKHPKLPALIERALRFTRQLFIESHAEWVLPRQENAVTDGGGVIEALAHRKVVLKISFDSMHDMSAHVLRELLQYLDRRHVNWLVAITELNRERFDERRMLCNWVPDSKIVFHTKAVRSSELYVPPLGTIRPDGKHLGLLSTRKRFDSELATR